MRTTWNMVSIPASFPSYLGTKLIYSTGSVKRLLSMYSNLNEESEKKRERVRPRRSVSKGLRNPPNKWAKEESQRLIQLVNDYGDKSWKKIAEHVGGGKTGAQCGMYSHFHFPSCTLSSHYVSSTLEASVVSNHSQRFMG